MNPLINSLIGVVFLIVGAKAVGIMIHLKGNAKDRMHGPMLIWAHRLFGYLFILIYVFMVYTMIARLSGYQDELSPRGIFHVVFALALIPLLAVKIAIARKYRLLTSRFFFIGLLVFLLVFLLNAITAGHYFMYKGAIRMVVVSSLDKVTMDENIGRQLAVRKCAKCHTLERVFRAFKDEEGWTRTVNRMALIDAPNIRDYDAKQIIFFLLKQQEKRAGEDLASVEEEIGKTLVGKKCSRCHNLERVYQAKKSEDEWWITVERMIKNARDPGFLTEKETDEIVKFLSSR